MTYFSFATIKIALKNLGFEIVDKDKEFALARFVHPIEKTDVFIGFENKLPEAYVKAKISDIHMPFEYFKSLTKTIPKLKKR